MQTISAMRAKALCDAGARLLDIRGADEFAREHIDGAENVMPAQLRPGQFHEVVIFHCRSGHRTQMQAAVLQASAAGEAYVLQGGLDAWKKAGLPVVRDASQPLEMQRQVQIAAGSLIVLGFVLGHWLPGFYWLTAFVGAGLIFAGVSGFCGMAHVLARMPWTRKSAR